jgi:AICAR transformylase/IMP cyclohydrolase PurH
MVGYDSNLKIMNEQTPLSKTELTHYTNMWCKELGIKSVDLGCQYRVGEDGKMIREEKVHPAIDDVIMLIRFREELWTDMNKHQRKSWDCFWKWTYTLKKQSRQKHLIKLEKIASDVHNNRLYKSIIKQAQRERIKMFRNSRQITAP